MRVALTQMDIVWEDKAAGRENCERLAAEASENGADMIVFPEMTLTGFTMNTSYAGETQTDGGETTEFFKELSARYDIAVIYGMVYISEDGAAYNRALMVQGDRVLFDYSKIHPFSYGEETKHYAKGDDIVSAEYNGADIGCFICYDLRFPEIFQISSEKNRIIAVIANWPEARVEHWNVLLRARAIENQAFIIGVNRAGESGGLRYAASSAAYSPYGERLTEETEEELLYADIDVGMADKYRTEFPLKRDRRESLYREYYDI